MASHRARSMSGPLAALAVVAVVVGGSLVAWQAGGDDGPPEPVASDGATPPTDPGASEVDPSEPSTPEQTPTETPTVHEPRRGDCRQLDVDDTDQALTEAGTDTVACADGHTAQTFATGRLPTQVDPLSDPDAVSDAVSTECRSGLVSWLGGDEAAYELSMFAYVVGVPSPDELEAGADWYRCDTYAPVEDGQLALLPRTTSDALAGDGASTWATCVDGELGTDPAQVLCRQPHDWRGVSAHRLADRGDPYPGSTEVADRTQSLCADDVATYVDDPLTSFDYGWLRPTEDDWDRGQRFVVCFAETTS